MAIALLVDDIPVGLPDSLEQAKKLAEPYIVENRKVSIERGSTTAPLQAMQTWNYCYKEQDWVEQK